MDTDLTGLVGITLAIVTLLAGIPRVQALPLIRRAAVLGAAIVLVSIPLWGVSAAGFVRGMTGDLSISTLVLLGLSLVRAFSNRVPVEDRNRNALLTSDTDRGHRVLPACFGTWHVRSLSPGLREYLVPAGVAGTGGLVESAFFDVAGLVHRARRRGVERGMVRIDQPVGLPA